MKPRILPAPPAPRPIVLYPEHGTGRASKLARCLHCNGKPLILRRCGPRRTCAVCQACGFHHRLPTVSK